MFKQKNHKPWPNVFVLISVLFHRYAKMGAGRNGLLTPEMETELAECLKVLACWGFGFTRQETRELIAEFLQASGVAEDGYIPTDDWLRGFMTRNPTGPSQLVFRSN